MTALTAWVVKARPPAELLDQVVITNAATGAVLATRPLRYGPSDVSVWNRTLASLGFERCSLWREAPDGAGFVCKVVRS